MTVQHNTVFGRGLFDDVAGKPFPFPHFYFHISISTFLFPQFHIFQVMSLYPECMLFQAPGYILSCIAVTTAINIVRMCWIWYSSNWNVELSKEFITHQCKSSSTDSFRFSLYSALKYLIYQLCANKMAGRKYSFYSYCWLVRFHNW